MPEINPKDREAEEYAQQVDEETQKLAIAYGYVFQGPAGDVVFQNLELLCNANAGIVRNKNNPDPNSVLFEAGKLAVINWIKYLIRVDNERRSN